MGKLIEFLKGYKSYGVLVAIIVVAVLGAQDIMGQESVAATMKVLVPLLGITLTAKANRFIESVKGALPENPN